MTPVEPQLSLAKRVVHLLEISLKNSFWLELHKDTFAFAEKMIRVSNIGEKERLRDFKI